MSLETEEPHSFIKFPSIGKLRHLLASLKKNSAAGNPFNFNGTVKLHGANASVCISGQEMWFQSRNQILSAENDRTGFYSFMTAGERACYIADIYASIMHMLGEHHTVAIFGEWCGKGIQKHVALDKLPRMFVIFAVQTVAKSAENSDDEVRWHPASVIKLFKKCPELHLFNTYDFPSFTVTLDVFNYEKQASYMKEIVDRIDASCPVAKTLADVDGAGEGVVWVLEDNTPHTELIAFKVKGTSHVNNANENNMDDDGLMPEAGKKGSLKLFIDSVCTGERFMQAYEALCIPDRKLTRDECKSFVEWIQKDVLREEEQMIIENEYEQSKMLAYISQKSYIWLRTNNKL